MACIYYVNVNLQNHQIKSIANITAYTIFLSLKITFNYGTAVQFNYLRFIALVKSPNILNLYLYNKNQCKCTYDLQV